MARFWAAFLFSMIGLAAGADMDCKRTGDTTGYDVCSNQLHCKAPYSCCDQACCYDGPKHELFSAGEVAGLVLCTTSIATTVILAIVICGATYCNSKEDKSHLFGNKH